ncbi:MAG: L-histidine N(alpha)-methyltransferase [Proteobacteria bacterium]|nr:L-histidine N(alpha)-methyltransferase [Pseudomonadota bacterium]
MSEPAIPLHDLHPEPDDFRSEVMDGLRASPKTLPCKYFYDERGSQLFDQICEADEYYPTRTEVQILRDHADELGAALGPECAVVEFGSGSSTKTHLLLRALTEPVAYVPVDISREHLMQAARRLAMAFPDLPVRPVCADFTGELSLPALAREPRRTIVFFPGSTIGNFALEPRRTLLARIARLTGPGGGLLIGIDLKKDSATLEPAYNDRAGITRDFNLNLLHRINRELDGDFDTDSFTHSAFYNQDQGRIEMHLVSGAEQTVSIGDDSVAFEKGESIRTECSYKFAVDEFGALASEAGFRLEATFSDPLQRFAVLWLETQA